MIDPTFSYTNFHKYHDRWFRIKYAPYHVFKILSYDMDGVQILLNTCIFSNNVDPINYFPWDAFNLHIELA